MKSYLGRLRRQVRHRLKHLRASEKRFAMSSVPTNAVRLVRVLRQATTGSRERQLQVAATLGRRDSELAPAHWAKWWLHHYAPDAQFAIGPGSNDAWVPLGLIDHLITVGQLVAVRLEIHREATGISVSHLSFKRSNRNAELALSICERIALKDAVSMTISNAGRRRQVTFRVEDSLVEDRIQSFRDDVAQRFNANIDDIQPTHEGLANYTLVRATSILKFRLCYLSAAKPAGLHDEWETLLRLERHPGICRPISYQESGEWDLLISDRVDGIPLDALDPEDLSIPAFSRILLQLADIAVFFKREGVAQLDFHPRNFHLSSQGSVKAFDFDIAALAPPDYYPKGDKGQLIPPYLAPLHSQHELLPLLNWDLRAARLNQRLHVSPDSADDSLADLLDPLLGKAGGDSLAYNSWHTLLHLDSALQSRSVLLVGDQALKVFCLPSIWGMYNVTVLASVDSRTEALVREFDLDVSRIQMKIYPNDIFDDLVLIDPTPESLTRIVSGTSVCWDRIILLSTTAVVSDFQDRLTSNGFHVTSSRANGLRVLQAHRFPPASRPRRSRTT